MRPRNCRARKQSGYVRSEVRCLKTYWLTTTEFSGALEMVEHHDLDLLLLDVQMPQVSGTDILAALRSTPRFKHLPIIETSQEFGTLRSLGCDV